MTKRDLDRDQPMHFPSGNADQIYDCTHRGVWTGLQCTLPAQCNQGLCKIHCGNYCLGHPRPDQADLRD